MLVLRLEDTVCSELGMTESEEVTVVEQMTGEEVAEEVTGN